MLLKFCFTSYPLLGADFAALHVAEQVKLLNKATKVKHIHYQVQTKNQGHVEICRDELNITAKVRKYIFLQWLLGFLAQNNICLVSFSHISAVVTAAQQLWVKFTVQFLQAQQPVCRGNKQFGSDLAQQQILTHGSTPLSQRCLAFWVNCGPWRLTLKNSLTNCSWVIPRKLEGLDKL